MEKTTLVITRKEIEQALSLSDYLPIIEKVHSCHAQHQVYEPNLLHADVHEGEFHLKTGGIIYRDQEYFGVKINGGFLKNSTNYDLPNILGMIYICDAQNGYPLAIMDSVAISRYRTGAATAVAAKYLAPRQSVSLGIFGYGCQAYIQVKAISKVCNIHKIRVSGRNPEKARFFAERLQKEMNLPVISDTLEQTARKSNIIITTTAARQYYLKKEWIAPGTFIGAIGADSPGKQELEPGLIASSVIIADIRKQVCQVGESQHAIKQGLLQPNDIYAELGEIITGQKECPRNDRPIVYDSTGTALQDLSVGITIYNLLKQGNCQKVNLFN